MFTLVSRYRFVAIAWMCWIGGSMTAWGYEEIAVTEGGALTGAVVLDGPVPHPKGYNLTTLPDSIYCGRVSDGHGWRLVGPPREILRQRLGRRCHPSH